MLGLANAGGDTVNSVEQVAEFGLTRSMKVVALLIIIHGVTPWGYRTLRTVLIQSFYWDLNDGTRAFSERFRRAMPGRGQHGQRRAATPARCTTSKR